MKVNKFVMLMISMGLVFGLMIGCGGGSSDDSITTPTSTTPTEIEDNVFVKQNEYAQQSVPDSYALFKAVNEELELLTNALGEGWEYSEWTEDDIRSVLSEDEIEQLVSQLAAIYNDKVVPSANAVELSLNGLINTEEEIQNLLNISGGLYKTIAEDVPIFHYAGLILGTWVAIGLGIAESATNRETPPENETNDESLARAIDSNKRAVNDLESGGKAGMISVATDLVTAGLSKLAATFKAFKLKWVIDTAGDVNTAKPVVVGINKCLEANITLEKQADIILNALDPAADGDLEISYLGQSDEDGVFHNIPEGDMTFVLFSEGNVRSVSSCIDFSGDEELITENITVTPIAEFEDLIVVGDVILPDTNTDSANIQVTIPGYTGPFTSNLTGMSFASINDGPFIYPAFISTDANSPEEFNIETSDTFSMYFNTTLSVGQTYPLNDDFELVYAELSFSTAQIVDENGIPIAFTEVSGSFTLTEYGTNVGDRLSGNFSCDVIGKRSEDVVINGHISGTFSGTLSAVESDVAVSKAMKVSF